jgi:hypothetical protein
MFDTLSSETFVIVSFTLKCNNYHLQRYTFTCSFVRVKTRPLTQRRVYKLTFFEKRELRCTFGSKTQVVV